MQNTQNAAGTALDNPSGPETENQIIVIGGMMSPAAIGYLEEDSEAVGCFVLLCHASASERDTQSKRGC